jgi:hypothetical protein
MRENPPPPASSLRVGPSSAARVQILRGRRRRVDLQQAVVKYPRVHMNVQMWDFLIRCLANGVPHT